MAKNDLQKKSEKDLIKLVHEKREAIRTLRFQGAGSGMRDTKAIRDAKKEIARALTVLNRRAHEESIKESHA